MADDFSKKDGPSLPPKLSLPKMAAEPVSTLAPEATGQPVPVARPVGSPRPVFRPPGGAESGTIKLKPVVRPGVKPVPKAPPGGAADLGKESTMRITLPASSDALSAAPPTQTPTIRTGPSTRTLTRPGATGGASSAAKKQTSRIPLDAASAGGASDAIRATEGPKTIRITPQPAVAGPATIKLKPMPAGAPKLGAAALHDQKKQTSRIPLDAALASDADAAEGPKTIRLKRPGAGPALKVDTGVADDERVGLGATSKIEETARIEADGLPTPTRRKTIKVKRPGQQPAVKTGPLVSTAMAPAAIQEVVEDQPCWFFPVVTVLAIFVVLATIYVFAAQSMGPNPSLTQLSYYLEGPDLGMPMKIQPPRQ